MIPRAIILKKSLVIALFACLALSHAAAAKTPQDRSYLLKLAKDTYRSILFLVDKDTGFPHDSSRFERPDTSVTNVGLYLAALVGAYQLGLETRLKAERKARKTLKSLERLETWHGFTSCWNTLPELSPSHRDTWISVLDTGNLAAGLILIASEFPALRARANALLYNIEWEELYAGEKDLLYGGYDLKKDKLNEKWYLNHLGSDVRLAYVIAIGDEAILPDSWDQLTRRKESRYGLDYLMPGWQGGGLFMQFLPGIFMDEAGSVMGESASRFAFAQIIHAEIINAKVWGWSACERPDSYYLGYNNIQDQVVTPHASVLAIEYFPEAVLANLRSLEALGARAPFRHQGKSHAFGFLDSVDIRTGEVNPHFLVLDQSMLFLSLVNYLQRGSLRKSFARHPFIQSAIENIPEYQITPGERKAFLAKLRSIGTKQVVIQTQPIQIADDEAGDKTLMKGICLINFTNQSYKNSTLRWKIVLNETEEVLNQGEQTLNLKRHTAIRPAAAQLKICDDRYDSVLFYLEAKLFDPNGKVLSEYLGTFPP